MNNLEVTNDYARFYINNGILHFIYHADIEIDVDAAKIIVHDRVKLQDNVSFPVLCDIRGLKSVNKTARDYLAKEGSVLTERVGLIVSSPAQKIMTNFYLMVNKPVVPTKVFISEEEAFQYLNTAIS